MKLEMHDLVKIYTNRTKQLMKLVTMVKNTSDDEEAC